MIQGRGTRDEGEKAACSAPLVPRPSSLVPLLSYIEEDLLNMQDVLQIEQPAQDHFDRQRHHDQEQIRADVVTGRAHLVVETAKWPDCHDGRQTEIGADEREPENLANDPELQQ